MEQSPANDRRGKQLVYVSSCLLDQNRRFPGIAVQRGAIKELIRALLDADIGIEQLPCLECLGWGGVSRGTLFRFLPTLYNHEGTKSYPLINAVAKFWLYNYRRRCQKEARKVVGEIVDLSKTGYKILAIIAMNDSPTCGATKTIHLLESIEKYKAAGVSMDDLLHPRLEQMQAVMPQVIVEGSGYFMGSLKKALEQGKLSIPILGFDPWQDERAETQRVMQTLLARKSD